MVNNNDKCLSPVERLGLYGFIDGAGHQIVDFKYEETDGFYNGLAKVRRNGMYGYINDRGEEVVPCQYDDIWSFCDGLARVRAGNKCGFVNTQGQELIRCIYDNADNYLYGYARVQKFGRWGHINTQGKEITSCKYDDVENFIEGLSRVCLDGKIGFVNTDGQEIIPPQYDWAELFSEGLSSVRVGNKYGYINASGSVIIPFMYEDAGDFSGHYAIVKLNGKYGVIDFHGDEVVPFQFNNVEIKKVTSALHASETLGGFSFVCSIISQIEQANLKEPYHINLLEEVHLHDSNDEIVSRVKENAHSRILRALLSYKYKGDYVILKSLIDFINSNNKNKSSEWINIKVSSPERPQNEIGRIDLLITEPKQYALIIENKINNAVDQNKQIARYINFVKQMGYRENQIFILYLSSQGENPSHQTWVYGTSNESYFNKFKNRFINFSFRNWVLPWLKDSVLPLVNNLTEEKLIQSAVIQYINYLETKYKMTDIDKHIKRIIENQLGLNQVSSAREKLDIVRKEMDATNAVSNYLDSLKTELLINEYGSKYPNLTLVEVKDYNNITAQDIDIAFAFKYKEKQYAAVIYRYDRGQRLYCGVFGWRKNSDFSDLEQKFNWLTIRKDRLFTPLKNYNDELINKLFTTANNLKE